jgi:hypothetical protein
MMGVLGFLLSPVRRHLRSGVPSENLNLSPGRLPVRAAGGLPGPVCYSDHGLPWSSVVSPPSHAPRHSSPALGCAVDPLITRLVGAHERCREPQRKWLVLPLGHPQGFVEVVT